jgi:hypothetical protein
MRVFVLLAQQRSRQADAGDAERAAFFREIVAEHVFHSDSKAEGVKPPYAVRQRQIWRWRGAKVAVLFNVDLLSTGVDLPCCDCVLLHSPSKNSNVILQRFGRCLRRVAADPGKMGTLAVGCPDPYALDDDQREEWELAGKAQPEEFRRQYDLITRVAECMLDPELDALGRVISVLAGARRGGGRGAGVNDDAPDGEPAVAEAELGEDGGAARRKAAADASLLKLMVSSRRSLPQPVLLDDCLVEWLQGAFGACARELRHETWAQKYDAAEAEMRAAGRWPAEGVALEFSQANGPREKTVANRRNVSAPQYP